MSSTQTNIIYFTNTCNMACTYCYEDLGNAVPKHTTKRELIDIANKIIKKEPKDEQTYFGLFGGEATLRWEECKYFMDYAYNEKQNVHFGLTTNGIKFLDNDFYNDFINNIHYKQGRLSLDVSFDGRGNHDRIYHNGDSTDNDVLQVLGRFKLDSIKYRLRYTINKINIDKFSKDISKLVYWFNPTRVIVTDTTSQFNADELEMLKQGKEDLIQKWNNQEITVPICEIVCETCNGCDISRDIHSYYIKNENIVEDAKTTGSFNHFEQKENNGK